MTTEKLPALYAEWIKDAVDADRGLVRKKEIITESVAAKSHLAAALKKIDKDLNERKYTQSGIKLSEEEKKKVLADTKLLLPSKPISFEQLIKEASLDEFAALADVWDQFFSEMK